MRILPVVFVWQQVDVVDGDGVTHRRFAMVPNVRYDKVAQRQYHEGEEYPMVVDEPRSMKSHNAFFAQVHSGYVNLPENIASRWPTETHFRKWCLIETNWFDEKEFEYEGPSAKRDARRLATFIRTEDDYARIFTHQVSETRWKVIVRRAKSQAVPAMKKQQFEDSKKAVLELIEHMISVPKGTLKTEAGRSA